ncbi:MAG: hypothetical protein R2830_08970 [Saprospiraceae bacterium]
MASTNPSINIDKNELLSVVSKMPTPELEKLSKQINRLVGQRREEVASKQEFDLLRRIRKPLFSEEQGKKYKVLHKKLKVNALTSIEHEEFLKLIQLRESKGVIRLESMIELAKLRDVSFDELLDQLDMTAPFPENA